MELIIQSKYYPIIKVNIPLENVEYSLRCGLKQLFNDYFYNISDTHTKLSLINTLKETIKETYKRIGI
jgi:hypothetical protein